MSTPPISSALPSASGGKRPAPKARRRHAAAAAAAAALRLQPIGVYARSPRGSLDREKATVDTKREYWLRRSRGRFEDAAIASARAHYAYLTPDQFFRKWARRHRTRFTHPVVAGTCPRDAGDDDDVAAVSLRSNHNGPSDRKRIRLMATRRNS